MNSVKIVDFKRYSSIHIGPLKEVLVINEIGDYTDYQIIGRANNLLISPNCEKDFAILGEEFDYIKEKIYQFSTYVEMKNLNDSFDLDNFEQYEEYSRKIEKVLQKSKPKKEDEPRI